MPVLGSSKSRMPTSLATFQYNGQISDGFHCETEFVSVIHQSNLVNIAQATMLHLSGLSEPMRKIISMTRLQEQVLEVMLTDKLY